MKPIRLQPFVSSGELYVNGKGEAELVPLSLFQTEDGNIVLRVGETTYWFTKDGVFDGPEARVRSTSAREQIGALLAASEGNKGKAPAESYFEPGTPGHNTETALWPARRNVS